MLKRLGNVVIHRGGAITTSVQIRQISTGDFKNKNEYKNQPEVKKTAIQSMFTFSKDSGFDDLGTAHAEAAGGFHERPSDKEEPFSRMTIQYRDENNDVMFFKKKDGSVWERIHLAEDPNYWYKPGEFKVATKEEFDLWSKSKTKAKWESDDE